MIYLPMNRLPDVAVFEDEHCNYAKYYVKPIVDGKASANDMELRTVLEEDTVRIYLKAETSAVCRVRVRWNFPFPKGLKKLGDAWERGYGELEWRGTCPNRMMPWYFLASDNDRTIGIGVKVRPASMAFWQ